MCQSLELLISSAGTHPECSVRLPRTCALNLSYVAFETAMTLFFQGIVLIYTLKDFLHLFFRIFEEISRPVRRTNFVMRGNLRA